MLSRWSISFRLLVTLASGGAADASETHGVEFRVSASKVLLQESIKVIHSKLRE